MFNVKLIPEIERNAGISNNFNEKIKRDSWNSSYMNAEGDFDVSRLTSVFSREGDFNPLGGQFQSLPESPFNNQLDLNNTHNQANRARSQMDGRHSYDTQLPTIPER